MRAKQLLHGALEYAEAVRQLEIAGNMRITVGVQGSKADETYEDGATLVDVANANEFGTDTIPERSFIRSTFDERREELGTVQKKALEAVADGRMDAERAAGLIGQWAASAVQKQITTNIPPPNAPSTIEAKGSSRTLIDSGRMRQAISYEIHGGKS